jgi:hypothetical protein
MTFKDTARFVGRHARRAGVIALGVLAAGVVMSFTVDLAALFPQIRRLAETAGSRRIERPLHIGGLSMRLFDGHFIVRDLVIDGIAPKDDPFLRAREIDVAMPLWSLLQRQLTITNVTMTDWQMKVETFPGGRHTFPRFASTNPSSGPSPIKMSVSYVHAIRGQFTYEDHGTPWSTVVRNLDVTVLKLVGYRGYSTSSGGLITVQKYVPMGVDLRTWFRIDDGKILLDRIELDTDGAKTLCTGVVDARHWPEQTYQVDSTIQMPRMREIWWANETFSLAGQARFRGQFHIYKDGRELKGDFWSDEATLNQFRFPELRGSLVWTRDLFEVKPAQSGFYGGAMHFTYRMFPLGTPVPTTASFDVTYADVDLAAFSDGIPIDGLRLAGRATGHNLLEWPLGRFAQHTGAGEVTAAPPAGVALQGRPLPARLPEPSFAHVYGDPFPPLGYVPIGGSLHYQYGPEWVDLAPSRIATPTTFVEFQGRTAFGDRSVIPFHVTSVNWQESDRLLAGIMTAFGSSTRPVEMDGAGTFDGVLLNAFKAPRIEGRFAARRMRAWDVEWGAGSSDIVIENSYLDVKDAVVRNLGAELRASGRFSLGYPRKDNGEQINARITATGWPMTDLRHAFDMDAYPLDGDLTGEFHLYGDYTGPHGFGKVTIAPATAYDEHLSSAAASLRFIGSGVWFDGVEIRKGTGTIRGAAHVEWAGTYSFNADGRGIPVESIDVLAFPAMPLTGIFEFKAGGSGAFAYPTYDVDAKFLDLYVKDEGIGDVKNGKIAMRGDDMNFSFEAGSPRLQVSATGKVTLVGDYPGFVTLQVSDTSLDPYARLFSDRLSPFASAIASGTVRIGGTLARFDGLMASATIDKLDLRLFDYALTNKLDPAGGDDARRRPIEIGLDQNIMRIRPVGCAPGPAGDCWLLTGENTNLGFSGDIDLKAETIDLHANGAANLGILQAFSSDLRGDGRADIVADVTGTLDRPQISGSARLTNSRLRHMWMPHAIENINGRITFAGNSIRLDDVTATMARGKVAFGGRVALQGLWPSQFDVTAGGEAMELRYPEGFRSVVDADLALRGTPADPVLSGLVTVRNASYRRKIDLSAGLVELVGAAGAAAGTSTAVPASTAQSALPFPLRFDLRIVAPPSTLEINSKDVKISANADLTLRGTFEKPALLGRAEVGRGELWYEGRRIVVTRGNIDFSNPAKIDPYFDIEAETRVRAPGQTYELNLRATGTMQRPVFDLSSDPPLPMMDIVSLLAGDVQSKQEAELNALRRPDQAERTLLQSQMAKLMTSPISSNVQKAVSQTFGVDTFQITPMLVDPSQASAKFSPGARLTIGQRISNRVYITYSQSLRSSKGDQVILLEYDQSDRFSWVLTRNEDNTYALDVRVRRVFK